jgi:hypothetical protein
VENTFRESWDIFPFFHAHILNACNPSDRCVMRLENVAQNVYSFEDENIDDARQPVAASEIRVKMKSRQAIWVAAGLGVHDFHSTDEWDVCAEINKEALKWAETHAPTDILKRYREKGKQLRMGPDLPKNSGPTFIWAALKKEFIKKEDENNKNSVLEIQSPTMRTDISFDAVPEAAGYHYCKLVSPAWFMDWIYTDSLRGGE